MDFMQSRQLTQPATYPVDTVLSNGQIQTDQIPCFGAFSWGHQHPGMKQAWDDWFLSLPLESLKQLKIIGVGVTEAGLASPDTPVMHDLAQFFVELANKLAGVEPDSTICVINTDNVPNNGQVLQSHMRVLLKNEPRALQFLEKHVVFLDSMVDRITSQRPNDTQGHLIPYAEPQPAKALVLLDSACHLPTALAARPGVVVRSQPSAMDNDRECKLRIANGTHTAIAHALALSGLTQTTALSTESPLYVQYLDALFATQIKVALVENGARSGLTESAAQDVYADWRTRLLHPHFGLSSFFITQNGPAKGGIRLGPTVRDLCQESQKSLNVSLALAFAILLRWLIPATNGTHHQTEGIFQGWLQGGSPEISSDDSASRKSSNLSQGTVEYADGLCYNLTEKWYTFRCSCLIGYNQVNLSERLQQTMAKASTASDWYAVIADYLNAPAGGNLAGVHCPDLVAAIAMLLHKLVQGKDILELLEEIHQAAGVFNTGFSTPCSVAVVEK